MTRLRPSLFEEILRRVDDRFHRGNRERVDASACVRRYRFDGMTIGMAVAIAANNVVESAGNFSGTVDFGGGTLTSQAGTNGGTPTNIYVFARAS